MRGTATLRRKKVLTPIVMVTARDQLEDRIRGLEAGADDYLVKPFASTELMGWAEDSYDTFSWLSVGARIMKGKWLELRIQEEKSIILRYR